jgi:hypothetical protein
MQQSALANMTTTKPVSTNINPSQSGITLHAEHLARLKGSGKSNGEILSWLHGKGVYSNLSEIAAFFQRREEPQGKTPNQAKTESSPDPNPNQERLSGITPPGLDELMALYKVLLRKKMAENDISDGSLKQINLMVRIVINYEQGRVRSLHREWAMQLKESENQLKARQQAASSSRSGVPPAVAAAKAENSASAKTLGNGGPAGEISTMHHTSARNFEQRSPIGEANKLPPKPAPTANSPAAGVPAQAVSTNHSG